MVDAPNRFVVEQARDRAMALLGQRFSEDLLDADELDERMEKAQTAETVDALRRLTADLEAGVPVVLTPFASDPPGPLTPPPVVAMVPADQVRDYQRSVALFGEVKHTGRWTPPRILTSFTALGSTEIDFREAAMAPGVTEVELQTFLGNVHVIVPPGLPVEVGCSSILASVKTDEDIGRDSTPLDPGAPRLRITGVAVLADIKVERRQSGESKRDAKQRKKAERKALRRAK